MVKPAFLLLQAGQPLPCLRLVLPVLLHPRLQAFHGGSNVHAARKHCVRPIHRVPVLSRRLSSLCVLLRHPAPQRLQSGLSVRHPAAYPVIGFFRLLKRLFQSGQKCLLLCQLRLGGLPVLIGQGGLHLLKAAFQFPFLCLALCQHFLGLLFPLRGFFQGLTPQSPSAFDGFLIFLSLLLFPNLLLLGSGLALQLTF